MEKVKMNWKPLVKMPKNMSSVSFITDESFLEEYNGRVKSDFDDASALKVLKYSDGIITGSNSPSVVLVNMIVEPLGMRVSNQADLEKAVSFNALPLQGQYEDTALVLRNENDPNEYLAKNLASQVKERGYNLNKPLVIPLSGLELIKDTNSPHKLAFKLTDKSQIIEAPILASDNGSYIDSAQMDNETGLPTKVFPNAVAGNRQLGTRNSGLSGLYLSRSFDVYSDDGNLAGSGSGGRVVLVSGEATGADFFLQYQQKLETQLQERKSELEKWFTDSMAKMPKK